MKAMTLWQPYAQAIALGLKKYETRSWATRHRGPIAIHASMQKMKRAYQYLVDKYNIEHLACGEIIVIADLTDCILMTPEFIAAQDPTETDFGDWQPGRYAWKLENVRVLECPARVSGKQGLWNYAIPGENNDAPVITRQLKMDL